VSVRLSRVHRAPQLRLSADGMTLTGEKGYRTVRATHAAPAGDWYFEVRVLEHQPPNACLRVGWATERADLQVPVGFDRHSYSVRMDGSKFHQSIGRPYAMQSFALGDVIGCHLHLPLPRATGAGGEDTSLPFMPGSRITFFRNGVSQGVAFVPLQRGFYFPAISLFMGARVTVNFGLAPPPPPPLLTADAVAAVALRDSSSGASESSRNVANWWCPPQNLASPIRSFNELLPVVDAVQGPSGQWIADR
jgi:Set1/Ash2 histone methyltransferase complex subunit ASH2